MSRRPAGRVTAGAGAKRAIPRKAGSPRIKARAILAGVLMVLVAGVVVWRLVHLQILEADRYVARGASQRIRTVPLYAARSAIVDRNGVDLALSVPRRSLVADPRLVADPVHTARVLGPLLGVDPLVLEQRLASDRKFVYLARQVDDRVVQAALGLHLSGVDTIDEQSRVRPDDGSVLAVVGRTDIDGQGISGLEKVYDSLLAGTAGEKIVEVGARGATIPGGEYYLTPATEGRTLVLTLDRALQFEAQRVLTNGVEAAGAKGGILVAMRPATGEILATVSVERDDDGVVRPSTAHRTVTWSYEPGSIIKPLTFSALLDAGLAEPDTVREVPYRIHVHDSDFTDSSPHENEEWTVAEIVRRSSNVGTILWAQEAGATTLHTKLVDFGLGQPTGLGFPGEAYGILPSVAKWSGTSLPTIAIGQGVATTPIQMLTSYATLANRGLWRAPTLVLGMRDHGGVFESFENNVGRRVVSEATAEELVVMIEEAVRSGTGARAQVPGYRVAGKTGTAWKPHSTGGYGEEEDEIRYVASFAGFLPADAPELVVLVIVDEPARHSYSGGRAAAPVFSEFAKFAVRQLRIPAAEERMGLDMPGRVMAATPAQALAATVANQLAVAAPVG